MLEIQFSPSLFIAPITYVLLMMSLYVLLPSKYNHMNLKAFLVGLFAMGIFSLISHFYYENQNVEEKLMRETVACVTDTNNQKLKYFLLEEKTKMRQYKFEQILNECNKVKVMEEGMREI